MEWEKNYCSIVRLNGYKTVKPSQKNLPGVFFCPYSRDNGRGNCSGHCFLIKDEDAQKIEEAERLSQ